MKRQLQLWLFTLYFYVTIHSHSVICLSVEQLEILHSGKERMLSIKYHFPFPYLFPVATKHQ